MYAQLFTQSPLLVLPLVALVLFAAVFLAVVARICGRTAAAYDAAARLPLESDEARHV